MHGTNLALNLARSLAAISLVWLISAAVVVDRAWAWGTDGHTVICEMAFRLTKPATQEKIRKLIAADPQYKTFADACNYPDQPRQRAEEHFINLPRDAAGLTSDQCPLAGKCILSAIHEDFGRLIDAKNDADMLDALKFLGHWVGDIHQPLHVSFLDDLGGNKITVSGCERSRNLHAVWDSCLVTFAIGPDLDDAVDHLLKQITPADIANWSASEPRDWANETFAITRSPSIGYCVMHGSFCDPASTNMTITTPYLEANEDTVMKQFRKAAVRLADLLNTAFSP